MADESPENESTHARRVRGGKRNRSLKPIPSDSGRGWPANLGELVQWYAHEVEDVTKAAQLRLQNATKVIAAYRNNEIGFEEAAERVHDHDYKWGRIFPGQIEDVIRGKSDEEILRAVDEARSRAR